MKRRQRLMLAFWGFIALSICWFGGWSLYDFFDLWQYWSPLGFRNNLFLGFSIIIGAVVVLAQKTLERKKIVDLTSSGKGSRELSEHDKEAPDPFEPFREG